MLALDAMQGNAPRVWLVLTTRTATVDMSLFYLGLRKLIKAARRRWPGAEYSSLLEFTTGMAHGSGGQRRPHWNVLLKSVPATKRARRELRYLIRTVWCEHVDAHPRGQHVGFVTEAPGLMRYLALHFQKESQAPPKGFRGQRFNCSRGYFTGMTRAEAREEARDSLREKRLLHRLSQAFPDLVGDELEDAVDAVYAREGFAQWGIGSSKREAVPKELGRAHVPFAMLEAAWEHQELGHVTAETAARLGLTAVVRYELVREARILASAGPGPVVVAEPLPF